MKDAVAVHRIVPNIYSKDLEGSKRFYTEVLNLELVMDLGWIMTFASRNNPEAQLSVLLYDKKGEPDNTMTFLSIGVSDVDKLYEKANRQNCAIVYPLTNEPWGVRRFFMQDPNGATLNILAHL